MIPWTVFALGLLKTLILIYDVITLPLYLVLQKPWVALHRSHRNRAKLERADDPYSPWIRIGEPNPYGIMHELSTIQNMGELFSKCLKRHASKRCYGYREVFGEEEEKQPNGRIFRKLILNDEYKWTSYTEADRLVDLIAHGFTASGIKHGDRVVIYAETRAEWMLSAQALFRIGAVLVTLYATLGDEGVVHGMNEADATHIVTSADLLPKISKLQGKLPKIKCLIYMENMNKKPLKRDENDNERFDLVSFSEVYKLGADLISKGQKLPENKTKKDDVAILMYTSGSTGAPKAVMITYKNFSAGSSSVINTILPQEDIAKDIFLGYLPLAHIFELIAELSIIMIGVPIAYSTVQTMINNATGLKRGCKGDVAIVKPTIMPAVPFILDRIRKNVIETVEKKGRISRGLFEFALDYKTFWTRKGFQTSLVNKLIFGKVKRIMGGELRIMLVGGAPLSPETQEFASNCLDCKVLQGYAATEATSAATIMDIDDLSFGRVGAPLFGSKIRLIDWREGNCFATDKPNPKGEILVGGDQITSGYFKNEAQTKENYVNEDGTRWWYTGDIGEIYPDGTLKIIDRKKDLVKLQFGEYISLGKVESELKSSDYVDNICVYGDSKYSNIIALIIPNRATLQSLAVKMNKSHLSLPEMCQDSQIMETVRKDMADHGTKSGLMKHELPTEIKLCSEEWVPDNGLVTAALKIRRKQIQDFYKSDISRMYGNNGSSKST